LEAWPSRFAPAARPSRFALGPQAPDGLISRPWPAAGPRVRLPPMVGLGSRPLRGAAFALRARSSSAGRADFPPLAGGWAAGSAAAEGWFGVAAAARRGLRASRSVLKRRTG